MLALPALSVVPSQISALGDTPSTMLPLAIVVGLAVIVLASIAFDLRRLRRTSGLRAVHGIMGAAFTVIVVGGTLAMSMALSSAPPATADQPHALTPGTSEPGRWTPAPEPESIDTSDVTDPSTDIQLPTLPLD